MNDKPDREFTCLLCPAGPKQFKNTSLAAVKMHLQRHLGCDATTREAMVKGSRGRIQNAIYVCGRGRTGSSGSETRVFSLPDPDGRKWLQEVRQV